MSIITYGHGICTDNIHTTIDKIKTLLTMAPRAYDLCCDAFKDAEDDGIDTVDEFADYIGQGWSHHEEAGLATILAVVINECEDIMLLATTDSCANAFLIMPEKLPWKLTDKQKALTEESLNDIFRKYINVLTDEPIIIEYQSIEND